MAGNDADRTNECPAEHADQHQQCNQIKEKDRQNIGKGLPHCFSLLAPYFIVSTDECWNIPIRVCIRTEPVQIVPVIIVLLGVDLRRLPGQSPFFRLCDIAVFVPGGNPRFTQRCPDYFICLIGGCCNDNKVANPVIRMDRLHIKVFQAERPADFSHFFPCLLIQFRVFRIVQVFKSRFIKHFAHHGKSAFRTLITNAHAILKADMIKQRTKEQHCAKQKERKDPYDQFLHTDALRKKCAVNQQNRDGRNRVNNGNIRHAPCQN